MKEQPSIDIQRILDEMANDTPEVVSIPCTKRKVKIGWMRNDTIRRISNLYLSKKEGSKFEVQLSCRLAALIVLNGFWRIKLFHWFLWRWYYYIRQYRDNQLFPIIEMGKKKAVPMPSWLNMIFLQGLNDTLATMTRKEAAATRREQSSDNGGN